MQKLLVTCRKEIVYIHSEQQHRFAAAFCEQRIGMVWVINPAVVLKDSRCMLHPIEPATLESVDGAPEGATLANAYSTN